MMKYLNTHLCIRYAFYLSLVFSLVSLQSCFQGSQDTYQCPDPAYFNVSQANKAKLGGYFLSQKIEYSHVLGSFVDTQAYNVGDTSSIYNHPPLTPSLKYGCSGNYYQVARVVLNPSDTSKMELGIINSISADPVFYFKFHKFDLSVPASTIPTSPDSTVVISSYQKALGDTLKISYSGRKGVQYIRTVNKPEIWLRVN